MSIRVLAFCGAFLSVGFSQAAKPTDLEKLQGVWHAVSLEANGKVDSGAALNDSRFVFEQNLVTIYQGNKRVGSHRFALHPKKNIPEIDFAASEHPTPATSKLGIYRFQNDALELCLGQTRPGKFRGTDGADFLTFKRPKPEATPAVPAWCLDGSPDGNRLAIAGGRRNGRGVVVLLNIKDARVALSHTEQRAATCVAVSPNGEKLAIGNQVGEVAILDVKTGEIENRWHTGKWAVFGITWTPDNRDVIAACANGFIKRFCADCGTLRTSLDTWAADGISNPKLGGHDDRNLWDVAVSRDGQTLLSGGWNGTTRLWNLTTGGMDQAFSDIEKSSQGVKFTPDERHIVSNGIMSQAVILRSRDTYEIRAELDAVGRDVAVHPDGKHIAASTLEEVRIFRLDLSEPTEKEQAAYRKLAEQLAETDEKAQTEAAEKLRKIGLPADAVLKEAARTAQGGLLSRIKQLREDIKSPKPIAKLTGHKGEIRQVVYSPTGSFLATSSGVGEVRIWNPETFELQQSFVLKLNP